MIQGCTVTSCRDREEEHHGRLDPVSNISDLTHDEVPDIISRDEGDLIKEMFRAWLCYGVRLVKTSQATFQPKCQSLRDHKW